MITLESRPKLASKARLKWDRKADSYLLLYPESGLILNDTASRVLLRCGGDHTVGSIIDSLVCRYLNSRRKDIEWDVLSFLHDMVTRGLLHEETDAP
jgi:pyrroloquinoline quinone biosynthesis protein D